MGGNEHQSEKLFLFFEPLVCFICTLRKLQNGFIKLFFICFFGRLKVVKTLRFRRET